MQILLLKYSVPIKNFFLPRFMLLEVKNLSVEFEKGKKVLENISFDVKKGEVISLIGLNGAGKTVLLKTIVGLINPVSGEVIKNTDNIFYIPQKIDLDTSFPLNVRELCELFGAEGNYEKYLKSVGMDGFLKATVSDLSGGEYQRVLIAIALSRKPDLLLLDEPVSGIDVAGEKSFYSLVKEIGKDYGPAIILVSHNIHLVINNADKVLCLHDHSCCVGEPKEVKETEQFKEIFGEHLQPYIHHHDHVH